MNAVIPDVPGPFRQTDGSPVAFADAKYEWAHAGYDALIDVARVPDGHITYQDIAIALQSTTGIQTRMPMQNWIGTPLGLVAEMCVRNKEPQLTALVVRAQTLEVGDGYVDTFAIAGQPVPKNLQRAAAETRAACYDHFSRREPVGWDRTKLTGLTSSAQVKARKSVARAKTEPVAPKVCPSCRLELLPSGGCGYCD